MKKVPKVERINKRLSAFKIPLSRWKIIAFSCHIVIDDYYVSDS